MAMPNASVALQGPAADDSRRTVTQENGFFQFADVEPSISYHVVVNAEAFASWTSKEIVPQGLLVTRCFL
jgi:hypothetical protein